MDYSSNRIYKNYLPCSPIYLDSPKNRGVNLFLGQSVCQVLSASEEKQYDQDQTKLCISIALAYHKSLALNNSLIVPNFVVLKPIQESGKLGWSWPGSFIASRVPGNKNLCILDTGKVRAFSIAACAPKTVSQKKIEKKYLNPKLKPILFLNAELPNFRYKKFSRWWRNIP